MQFLFRSSRIPVIYIFSLFTVKGWAQEKSIPLNYANPALLAEEIKAIKRVDLLYPDSAIKEYRRLFLLSKEAGYPEGKINTLFYSGNLSMKAGKYRDAIRYYRGSVQFCDSTNPRHLLTLSYIHVNMANAYSNLSEYKEAYRLYMIAAHYAGNDSLQLSIVYGNTATVLGQLNQFHKTMDYLDMALAYGSTLRNYESKAVLLVNKGRCYYELGDIENSALYIDSCIGLSRNHKINITLRAGLVESARLDIATGKPADAIPKLQEAIQLGSLPGMPINKGNEALTTIGNAYLQLGDYAKARHYLGYAWTIEHMEPEEKLFVAEKLADLYARTHKYKKAYELQRSYITLNDSLKNATVVASVNELETRYRTSEKDREIIAGRLKISNQEKKMAEKNSLIFGIAFIAMTIIMLLLWRYFYVSQKNRKLKNMKEIEYLKAVMEGEQKERARIATELHDSIVSELTIVKMNLEVAAASSVPSGDFKGSLHQLSAAINNVRNTAHNLMPEIVLRYDLPHAIGLLCETIQKTGRLKIEFQQYGDFTQLQIPLKQTVYAMVQELLHNIIKHAQASRALVQLSCYNSLLTINIEDNGIGITGNKWQSTSGMGLNNLAKRVSKHNGRMEWTHPGSGDGTNVYIEFDI